METPGASSYDTKSFSKDLDKLEMPGFGADSNKEKFEVLTNLLKFADKAYKEGQISGDLFRQIMITGGELHTLLNIAEKSPTHDEKLVKYYLNIYRKFEGEISSEAKKDVLSTSLTREIDSAERDKTYEEQVRKLPEASRSTFLNTVKLDKYFMNPEDGKKWQDFCVKSCETAEYSTALDTMVKSLVRNNIHEYWLNSIFLEKYEANPATALSELKAEYDKTMLVAKPINDASKLLDQMEHQIGEWAQPKNFAKLHKELQANLEKLDDLLKYDPTDNLSATLASNQFFRQIDIIDKSIKALQISSDYSDKTQQVANFKLLLEDFWNLLKKQPEINERISYQLYQLEAFLKETHIAQEELLTSPGFSVLQTNLFYKNRIDFARGMRFCKHLADFHSIVHQNALSIVEMRSKPASEALISRTPKAIKDIEKLLRSSIPLDATAGSMFLYQSNIELIGVSLTYPKCQLVYNIPLGNHSANLRLDYNYKTGIITLTYDISGEGARGGNRWTDLEKFGVILLTTMTDAKIIHHESQENMLNFKLEINPSYNKQADLAKTMYTLLASTFDDNSALTRLFTTDQKLYNQLQEQHIPSISLFTNLKADFDFNSFSKFIAEHPKDQITEKYGIDSSLDPKKLALLTSGNALYIYDNKYIPSQELAKLEPDKIQLLVRDDAIETYKSGHATFKELAELSVDKIQALTSADARGTYEAGIPFKELAELPVEKIQALTSWEARTTYQAGISFRDLAELPVGKIQALTSMNARATYKAEVSFKELAELPVNKIQALTSSCARATYEAGASFKELAEVYDHNQDKFKALTSWDANYTYKAGISFKELTELPVDKIQALTSDDTRATYQAGASFRDLSDLYDKSPDKIKTLTSADARATYREGVPFKELAELPVDKIKTLTSADARHAYQAGFPFKELAELPVDKIQVLTSWDARETYGAGASFRDLSDLYESLDKFKALTSRDAKDTYRAGIPFKELAELPVDKIQVLTSMNARVTYQAGIPFKELAELPVDKIQMLTSWNAIYTYREGASFRDLSELYDKSPDKFKALTLRDLGDRYTAGASFRDLSDLYDKSPDKFKTLTSADAIYTYREGTYFRDLSELYDKIPDKFKVLTSAIAITRYKEAHVTFKELAELPIDKLQALTSSNAIEGYKIGISFKDLVNFDKDKIQLLTSPNLREIYKLYPDVFKELSESPLGKIQALTSPNAINVYQAGINFKELSEFYDSGLGWFDKFSKKDMIATIKAKREANTADTISSSRETIIRPRGKSI